MGASSGKNPGASGTGRAQYHLRQSFVFLEMTPVQQPELLMTGSAERFDAAGELIEPFYKQRIPENLAALIKLVKLNKNIKA